MQIGQELPRLHVYEALFPAHERLVQSLSLIYVDLLSFCYEAKKVLRKPKRTMFNSSWKSFENQFGQLLKRFKKHRNAVQQEVSTSHMVESAEYRSLVRSNQTQIGINQQGELPKLHRLSQFGPAALSRKNRSPFKHTHVLFDVSFLSQNLHCSIFHTHSVIHSPKPPIIWQESSFSSLKALLLSLNVRVDHSQKIW